MVCLEFWIGARTSKASTSLAAAACDYKTDAASLRYGEATSELTKIHHNLCRHGRSSVKGLELQVNSPHWPYTKARLHD